MHYNVHCHLKLIADNARHCLIISKVTNDLLVDEIICIERYDFVHESITLDILP